MGALRSAAIWCGRKTCRRTALHGHWRTPLQSMVGFLPALVMTSTICWFSAQAHHCYLQNQTRNQCLGQNGVQGKQQTWNVTVIRSSGAGFATLTMEEVTCSNILMCCCKN